MKILGIIVAVLVILLIVAWLKLRGPDIPYETLEAKYAGSASHFVGSSRGISRSLRGGGRSRSAAPGAAARVRRLVHQLGWVGAGAQAANFTSSASIFPVTDSRGRPPEYVLGGERLADFVDAFAAALSLPKFAVAGNSMGGGVAWQLGAPASGAHQCADPVDAGGFPNEKPPAKVPLAFKILQLSAGAGASCGTSTTGR